MKTQIRGNSGFTLIELLIGLTIVSFIIAGVSLLFRSQVQSSVANQEETELSASVQAAANMIMQDIVMAGFGGVNPAIVAHTNVGGTTAGADTLIVYSAGQGGAAIASFVYAGSVGVGGNTIYVRCYGVDGQGGYPDSTRDVIKLGTQPMTLYFINPFKGTLVTGITNPQTVTATNLDGDGKCLTDQAWDFDNQPTPGAGSNNDPVIEVKLSPGLTSPIQRGTTVYGFRGATPSVTYSLDVANQALLQNGVPILYGVEDFQVQFRLTGQTVWLNSLAAVDTKQIAEVAFALLVKGGDSTAFGADPRTSFTLFDHTVDVSASPSGSRQRHEFRVRPKNTTL